MKQKIIITGGHLSPAVALIEELSKNSSYEIVFIGRRHAMEGSKAESQEYSFTKMHNIRFIPIVTGRMQRSFTKYTLLSFIKIPLGFFQAMYWVSREHPALVVSFGGYVAVPVAISAWLMGVPVFTHEQTMKPGIANRIIGKFAKRIFVTFEETKRIFPINKTEVIGLPIRSDLLSVNKLSPIVSFQSDSPLIYITGGSQGASSLNKVVFPIINALSKKYSIVHQVGGNDILEAKKYAGPRYIPFEYIQSNQVSWVLQHAKFIIGRAGANTVYELAVLGKVAILIPLPWSGAAEQEQNAKWLSRNGGAFILEQKELTPDILHKKIQETENTYKERLRKAQSFAKSIPTNAATLFAQKIEKQLSHV